MKQKYEFNPIPFSPSEVEEITGLTTTLQRDWRRRGILQKRREISTFGFSPEELASIVVLMAVRALTDTKVETAASHAESVAKGVLRYTLDYSQALSFEGTSEERAGFEKIIRDSEPDYLDSQLHLRPTDYAQFSVWHSGKWEVVDDIADVFDEENRSVESGIVLCHLVLAARIAKKITHPMFSAKVIRPRSKG